MRRFLMTDSHPDQDTVEPGPVAEAGVLQRLRLGQLQVTGPHLHCVTVPLGPVPLPPVGPPLCSSVAPSPQRPAAPLQGGHVAVGELLPSRELVALHHYNGYGSLQ